MVKALTLLDMNLGKSLRHAKTKDQEIRDIPLEGFPKQFFPAIPNHLSLEDGHVFYTICKEYGTITHIESFSGSLLLSVSILTTNSINPI